LRQAAQRKVQRGAQAASQYSIAAPIKGWNAKDSLANMDEEYANSLINMFPEPTSVRVRKGYADHVTGIGSQVESLMPYNKPDGTQTLFCAAGTDFYNVTSSGAVGAAVVSSLTNARWEDLNFTNSSGTSYLCCFNGTDSPRYWNGSAWTTITGVSSPAITGLTTSDIVSAVSFKRRMYLVEKDSLKLWYLPVDSVGGLAKSFDLAGIAYKGGYIMAAGTWTLDAGEGLDDYLAVVTSEGQVVVYQGTDPSSSSSWSLIGVWNIGEPIGRRCLMKFRGDLLLIGVDGVFPLSAALIGDRTDPKAAITYPIMSAMAEAAASYKTRFGWSLCHYPGANMLLLNVPVKEGSEQEQYAMNTITGAFGQFQDIAANCWCIFNEKPYFGGNGVVGEFWQELSDNGNPIAYDMQQAFSYFGTKRIKQFTTMRPTFLSDGIPDVGMGMSIDFNLNSPLGSTAFQSNTAMWDVAMWDVAFWAGSLSSYSSWQTVFGVGIAAAQRMSGTVTGAELHYVSTDYLYEHGGVIG